MSQSAKPTPPTRPTPAESTPQSAYDALAELFLGDACAAGLTQPHPTLRLQAAPIDQPDDEHDLDAESNRAAAVPCDVEGLIVGHLPVLASAWIGQYAKWTAEQIARPVGLVRIQGGHASVDVYPPPGDEPHLSQCDSIRASIHACAGVVGRWIVRVDETHEPELLASDGVSLLTVLTGADQAAIVASYRSLKGLQLDAEASNAELPSPVHVVVMGAEADDANAAADRLAHSARVSLGLEIQTDTCSPRITSRRVVSVYRGRIDEAIADVLALIPDHPAAPETTPPNHRQVEPKPAPVRWPAPSTQSEGPTAPQAQPAPSPRTPEVAPDQSQPRLAAHIEGLFPLSSRCPWFPEVELAIDASGSAHLLAHVDTPGAIRGMLIAEHWLREHESLLRRAEPDAPARSTDERPTLHLFVSAAADARHLASTRLHVHLLTPVPAGATVVCTRLA